MLYTARRLFHQLNNVVLTMSDKRDDFTSFFFFFCVSRAEAAEEETLCVETSKLSLGADDPRDDDGNLKVNASS